MKICYLCSLVAMLPLVALSTQTPASETEPAGTASSHTSSVFKDNGEERLLAFLADDDADHPGKGKGKAKGKAKGHDKDKNKDKDKDKDKANDTETVEGESAPQNQAAGAPASTPSAQPPVKEPTPATRTPAAASSTSPPQPKRSTAEIKAEMNRHLGPINKADKATAFSAVAKETGVPLATLQAQNKTYPVGPGALLIANEMAKATKKPAVEFVKARQQGRQWDRIAADNNFDLNTVIPKLQRVHQSVARASR